jgi:hypothetical protein
MALDAKDWNYDRIHSAHSLICDVQNDMMRCLHRGEVIDVVRERIIQRLGSAVDSIERLRLSHDVTETDGTE